MYSVRVKLGFTQTVSSTKVAGLLVAILVIMAKQLRPLPPDQFRVTGRCRISIYRPLICSIVPTDYINDPVINKAQMNTQRIFDHIITAQWMKHAHCQISTGINDKQILDWVRLVQNKFATNEHNFDSLICLIHGHGDYFDDSHFINTGLNDEWLSIESLTMSLSSPHTAHLKDIPKILITGYCQGNKLQDMSMDIIESPDKCKDGITRQRKKG